MVKYSNKEKEIMDYLEEWIKNQKIFKKRQEIAKYLHISYSHFGNIILGKRQASSELIKKIAIMIDFDNLPGKQLKPDLKEDYRYKEFTELFRKWFYQEQTRFKTQKELAKHLNIDNSTISKYLQGKSYPKEKLKERLYEISGIELIKPNYFKDDTSILKSDKIEINKSYEINIDEILKASKKIEKELESLRQFIKDNKNSIRKSRINEASHKRFARVFYDLAEEIFRFRDSGIKDREKLRSLISPKDVGYVSSFLRALFDEDKFSDFILFSNYEFEMKGEKKNERIH
jgi:transcriptional regulator with XRE-family HTH domain